MGTTVTKRRLIERLSGWRLLVFLCWVAINLLSLAGIGFARIFPTDRWLDIWEALVFAQIGLLAISIGGFQFSFLRKLAVVAISSTFAIWAVRNLYPLGVLDQRYLEATIVILVQSLILVMLTSWLPEQARNHPSTFAEWLAVTAFLGLSILAVQTLLPDKLFRQVQFWRCLAVTTLNSAAAASCLLIGLATRRRKWGSRIGPINNGLMWCIAIVGLGGTASGVFWFNSIQVAPENRQLSITPLVVFCSWLLICFLSTIGFDSRDAKSVDLAAQNE